MKKGKTGSKAGGSSPSLIKPIDALKEDIPKEGLAFWRSHIEAGETLPHVDQIDPLALRNLLPHIVLIDVIWPNADESGTQAPDLAPVDFRYRLVGGHSADTHDANLTGMRVSELSQFGQSYTDTMLSFYRNICEQKAPVAAGGPLAIIGKGYREFEGIYMPFTETGDRVDRLMAVVVYL